MEASGCQLRVLGSGNSLSPAGRGQAAYLVTAEGATALLDCGVTTIAALRRDGIDVDAIDVVFLSHLHGDHFAGLPFLYLAYMHESGRTRPLRVIGPPGTQSRVEALFAAMYPRTAARPRPIPIDYEELGGESSLMVGDMTLSAFPVPHQVEELSFGCRVEVGGAVVVYSGDTGWSDELIQHAHEADLFLCECTYFDTRADNHLDYVRLSERRAEFTCRRMVLTHFSREVLANRDAIDMEMAADGMVIQVGGTR